MLAAAPVAAAAASLPAPALKVMCYEAGLLPLPIKPPDPALLQMLEDVQADGVALTSMAHPAGRALMTSAQFRALVLPGLQAVFTCAYEGHTFECDRDVCSRCQMTAEQIEEAGAGSPFSEEWADIFEPDPESLEDIEIEVEPTLYGFGRGV